MLTEKTKTREKFSRISKSEIIIREILYCLTFVLPYQYVASGKSVKEEERELRKREILDEKD